GARYRHQPERLSGGQCRAAGQVSRSERDHSQRAAYCDGSTGRCSVAWSNRGTATRALPLKFAGTFSLSCRFHTRLLYSARAQRAVIANQFWPLAVFISVAGLAFFTQWSNQVTISHSVSSTDSRAR